MKKILHLGNVDKFIAPFVDFNENNFKSENHEYMFYGYDKRLTHYHNVFLCRNKVKDKIFFYPKVYKKIKEADLVIMHSLNNKIINLMYFILMFSPILHKVYWVMWGGDLYAYRNRNTKLKDKIQNFYKKQFLPKIGGLISYLPGDFELAEMWYGCKGKRYECLAYQSNLYKPVKVNKENKDKIIKILVGNSADPTNNHKEVFDKIKDSSFKDYLIYCPLSYGNKLYRSEIISYGYSIFGGKFKPMVDNISFDEYNDFLNDIDVAIFNHDRQQAMGTTISLLGFGIPVYLRESTSQWYFFKDKGINVHSVEKFELDLFKREINVFNVSKVEAYFSESNLISQWGEIYKI
ncbi:TDP-N-acetylfucosamine:lipid II N-acetylfucosaminyltransferase [Vibrio sp. CK2-1]|uniref:TDP-N-acetylfucosamine:lipid II N-acetylfucosaminyltransferase n=1 Tax=Vibrio sp. CK2-1 TaxID=2912249 RepID=UPI001F009E5C|nr:TDP-N-acetylfucosamine:lipid II N-acetylfucosaminyltransferase [Vibrio sp. CK2-1]MCF7355392.1 TDP-N-acetylfucosamine:lipid II N-acetylfucosaminyltransferase [Vibrio sp. CK2-1]